MERRVSSFDSEVWGQNNGTAWWNGSLQKTKWWTDEIIERIQEQEYWGEIQVFNQSIWFLLSLKISELKYYLFLWFAIINCLFDFTCKDQI